MAKKEKISNIIRDFGVSGNFGEYGENVGGGESPHPKDPNKRAPGVNSSHRREYNDTQQPRTDDGKFTYKSANGKKINPKYGPSRGKTVNPVLTGGKNGVYIDDVKEEFEQKEGDYWDKYRGQWYDVMSEAVKREKKFEWHTHVAADAIWNVAKEFDTKLGEFKGESTVFDEIKKGRRSAEENKEIKDAKKDKKSYSYVKEKGDEAIKKFRKAPSAMEAKEPEVPAEEEKPQPVIPAQPVSEPTRPAQEKRDDYGLDAIADKLVNQYAGDETRKNKVRDLQNKIKNNTRSTKKNNNDKVNAFLTFTLLYDDNGRYSLEDREEEIDEIINRKNDYASDEYLNSEMENRQFVNWYKAKKEQQNESPQAQKVRAMGFTE